MRIRGWVGIGLVFVLTLWMASCLREAYAQTAPAPGTYYANPGSLENVDVAAINSAQQSIDLAAFSLTDKTVVDALRTKAAFGVKIRIYLDRGELQAECRGDATCARIALHELIGFPGVTIKVKYSKVLMHLKSYAMDGSLVRDGSANFSEQGERLQDNSAVLSADPRAYAVFQAKFRAMWERPDNLTVARAVAAGTVKPALAEPEGEH